MVRWGEAGGRLPESLEHLATQLEHERELQAKVRGALVYPLLVVGAVILIGGLLAVFVLPQIVEIFETFDVELPLMTRIFLGTVRAVQAYGLVAVPAGVVFLAVLLGLLRARAVRPRVDRLVLRLPIVGNLVRMVNLARMNRAFGSLIRSDIPIVESLSIVRGLLGSVLYNEALTDAVEGVRGGVGLGRTLQRHGTLFPPIETDMVIIGEETGKLDEVFLYLADFYEENVNAITRNIAQTIEPLLLLVVGVVVGGVVLSVLLPIYQISESIV